jgi:hypothetical protein
MNYIGQYTDETKRHFVRELMAVTDELLRNERDFNMAEDANLLEAISYERLSLLSRHAYLMKCARENGYTIDTVERMKEI